MAAAVQQKAAAKIIKINVAKLMWLILINNNGEKHQRNGVISMAQPAKMALAAINGRNGVMKYESK